MKTEVGQTSAAPFTRITVTKVLLTSSLLVIAVGTVAHLIRHLWIADEANALSHMLGRLDLVEEPSLNQWFSSSLHLIISSINFLIAFTFRGKLMVRWLGLSLLFLITSMDEAIMIHEMLDRPTKEAFGTSDWFSIAWIIPGALFALLIGLSYLTFLRSLPKITSVTFVLAGVIFLSGSVLMEIPGGHFYETYGFTTWHYIATYAFEELLELVGLVLFVHGLLYYVATQLSSGESGSIAWTEFWQAKTLGATR